MKKTKIENEKIVKGYLSKYPDMKTYTIAELIYNENKEHFSNLEAVRSNVRYYRGLMGHVNRGKINRSDSSFQKELTYDSRTVFHSFKSLAPKLQTFTLPKSIKEVLFLSDIHLPYHDEQALITALQYGKDNNVDCIWLNGDIMDMFQCSDHEKLPGKADMQYEFDFTRDFFARLRSIFPKAIIYYLEGNHEVRWRRYLMRKAPEIIGIPEFRLDVILKLREFNVEWIPNGTLCKFGHLNVIHGNEFKGGGGVNPARTLFLRAKDNIIAGDKHKTGENNEGTLNGKLITCWAVGALCDLNPEYLSMAHTIWNHGFAHISMNLDGTFKVRNMRIKNGEIL
jgi:hypothetical protein